MSVDIQDLEARERQLGTAASRALQAALRDKISSKFKRRSGALERTTVSARYRQGRLDRLVTTSPRYSFTEHYGSSKTGKTGVTNRKGTEVKGFLRRIDTYRDSSAISFVKAHSRKGGTVKAHDKNEKYEAKHHISEAFNATNALQVLATELGSSRAIVIISNFDY